MPLITKHLPYAAAGRVYDDAELERLQTVYARGCTDLDLEASDPQRETFAALIFQVADTTDNVSGAAQTAGYRIREVHSNQDTIDAIHGCQQCLTLGKVVPSHTIEKIAP